MGLDMYLNGKKYFMKNWRNPELNPKSDGFEVKVEVLRLGYWRKHPNLHGYIVNTFADGLDECQEIYLDADEVKKVIQAIKDKQLPHTTGFFFGVSDGSEDDESIQIFEKALQWLEAKQDDVIKNIIYQASW